MRASWIAFSSLAVFACATSGGADEDLGGGGSGPGVAGSGGSGAVVNGGAGTAGDSSGDPSAYPETCAEAAEIASYIGCDFWPTVTANPVWEEFDFTVVVANAGESVAQVEVTQGAAVIATTVVDPNSLVKIYLPWVPGLKGPEFDLCAQATYPEESMFVTKGAYHLRSTVPVTAYQFSALEYSAVGGPAGKTWSGCPGNQTCPLSGEPVGCFSFSNDASLLLPQTTLTTNYRVVSPPGLGTPSAGVGPTLTVTATEDGTVVTVQAGSLGGIAAGGGIVPAIGPNQNGGFSLNAGDVVQMVGTAGADLSGALVQSTKPVQVISGMPCLLTPEGKLACDHVEETVFPAETLGKRYVVSRPTGADGFAVPHVVRLYGNVDGTTLTYRGAAPAGAPSTINAGQMVQLAGNVMGDFEVEGNHAFAIGMLMVSAEVIYGRIEGAPGDPSLTLATAVEQYRTKYVFLAPTDYDVNFVDITLPAGATVSLDGTPLTNATSPVGDGSFSVMRVTLPDTANGTHLLESDYAFGIQVMGYGTYTSYHYPGGLDLRQIAPPPPPIK